MKDYSNYRPSTKDNLFWSARKIFNQQLEDNGDGIVIDGIETKGLITTHTNPLNETKEDRKLKCLDNIVVKRGSLIDYDNEKWMVITKPKLVDNVYKLCKIYECNRTFTWQDQQTLEILSYPCIYEDKTSPYNDGLETNKHITLADDQALITIQNNLHTKKIKLDKRIMFNNDRDNVYKITKIQDLVHDGLIYIVLSRDTYNEASDNIEINICNYIEPSNDIIIGEDYQITITGGDFIYFNREREYVATVYNGDEIVDNMDILWTLDNSGLAEIISQDGTSCVVKSGNVYGYVNLKCELVGNDDVWSSKEILIRSIM